jgi:hypothetical protein
MRRRARSLVSHKDVDGLCFYGSSDDEEAKEKTVV